MHHRKLQLLLIAILAAAPGSVDATEGTPEGAPPAAVAFEQSLAESWSQMVNGIDDALDVPREMRGYRAPAPGADCDTLYLEVGRLLPLTHTRYPDFYSNPAVGASFALGTVFPPGFYLMGAPEYARFRERPNVREARAAVAVLRARLADMSCYTR